MEYKIAHNSLLLWNILSTGSSFETSEEKKTKLNKSLLDESRAIGRVHVLAVAYLCGEG